MNRFCTRRLLQNARLVCSAFIALAVLAFASVASAEEVPLIGNASAKCGKAPAEIYREVAPSIVQIFSFGIDPYKVANRVRAGTGSGIYLGNDLVATNFHVIVGATAVGIGTDENVVEAKIIGIDPIFDIAILKSNGLSKQIKPMALAPSDDIVIGQTSYVIGFPLGIGKSISSGIVSGVGRELPLNPSSWLSPYIQTDAAISGGNSGGALLDDCGYLIGIVALRGGSPEAENIGFAIPAETLRNELPELIKTGKIARPWYGLYGRMVNPVILGLLGAPQSAAMSTHGFLVETVEPGSAADKAGIRGGSLPVQWGLQEMILGGDIIVEVDGREIKSLEDARYVVRNLKIGETVKIKLLREGKLIEVSAKMEERPILERDLEAYRHQ